MSTLSSKFRTTAIVIAAVSGLTIALGTTAQPGSGFGPGFGPGMMMGRGGGPIFAPNNADFAKFQQDRFVQLNSQLGITTEQQPAWDAFAAKAVEQAKTMQALRNDATAGTAPERMKQRQQAMGERQKTMESMSESFTRLYEVLTPQQREVFDRSFGPMHRQG